MVIRNFIRSIIFFLLLISCSQELLSASLKKLPRQYSVVTPASEFFGSLSVLLNTDNRWYCIFNDDFLLEIIPWTSKTEGDYWKPQIEYKLYSSGDDEEYNLLAKETVESDKGISGFKFIQSGEELGIYAPGGKLLFENTTSNLPKLNISTEINLHYNPKAEVVGVREDFEKYPIKRIYTEESIVNSLAEARGSDNSVVGYWKYLDRVTPKDQHVIVGGRYIVAIVPDVESLGEYQIIYLSGASDSAGLWETGALKGRLVPTSFDNNYDLEWYGNHGHEVGGGECSATVEGANLLTFDFPLLESQIRFQKIENGF